MLCYNIIPLTNKPTWVKRNSANTIDHMITNSVTGRNAFRSATKKIDLLEHFRIVFAEAKLFASH